MDIREPPPAVEERWQKLFEDAEVMAAEYAEEGVDPFVVHPGDVTPITGDPYGLDVLAPGDEFEKLEALVEEASFDTTHVYYADEGGTRFFVIVVEGEANGEDVAVLVPAFLAIDRTPRLARQATDEGIMYTHVRPLSDDSRVTFSHDDPELFF